MPDPKYKPLVAREYYPYITRSLIELYNDGVLPNVANILVEPHYGYVTRITYTDGTQRITYGNDMGLNTAAATELAKDKGHTKFLLRAMNAECPNGDEFLLPWWADIVSSGRAGRGNTHFKTTEMAPGYITDHGGYPVYVKPIDGSKGGGVYKVYDEDTLKSIFQEYEEKRIRLAMVEEPIPMPDYRIVVLDGRLISAYQRIPLAVTGNGRQSVRELLAELQAQYFAAGRDTLLNPNDRRIQLQLQHLGTTLDTIPDKGAYLPLSAISNLSAGGTSKDIAGDIASRWVELANDIAANFSLRICGVDLACADITSPNAAYSVLEVNASPGLDHFAMSGRRQEAVVKNFYAQVFNAFPKGDHHLQQT